MEQLRERVALGARPAGPAPAEGPPAPPRRHSLRDQVLCALRGELAAGALLPGRVYSAPALAARFQVSATPVREAMQQLVREGAVEVVHNRGFRVAAHSTRDLAELAEVRVLLEVPVLLRLARSVRPECWEALRPLAQATVTAAGSGDRAAYAEADRDFHRTLLGLGGNARLVEVADGLHQRAQWPAARGAERPAAELLAEAAEHAALLDALTVRDLPAVESVARGHFAHPAR